MAGRKKHGLAARVRDGQFLARRHADLLDSDPLVDDAALREVQEAYRDAYEDEKRVLALEFEQLVDGGAGRFGREQLDAELDELGPRGSAERVIGFFSHFIRHEDGRPWALDEWQQEFLREAYLRDEDGRRVYKVIVLGIPRGNGKTPLATGISLDALLAPPPDTTPRIFQAAGSRKQAGLGREYAEQWVDGYDVDEPGKLAKALKVSAHDIVLARGLGRGFLEILSSDGDKAHGLKPTVGVVDEWWEYRHAQQRQVWTALRTALHKIQDAFLMAITTAGYDSDGSQLNETLDEALQHPEKEELLDGCLTIVRDRENGFLLWWYGAPADVDPDSLSPAELLSLVEKCNPGSWIDHRELLRSRNTPDADELEWRRLVLNQRQKTKGAWFKTGQWKSLSVDPAPVIPGGAMIYVAVDAARGRPNDPSSGDCTAVGWAWKRPADGKVIVGAHSWSPRKDALSRQRRLAHDFIDDPYLDNTKLVIPFIDDLASRYRIMEIVCDERYFHSEMLLLGERFTVAPISAASTEMRMAEAEFEKAVKAERIEHDGDPVVTRHVEATAQIKTAGGGAKIDKNTTDPIDCCTTLVISHSRAILHIDPPTMPLMSWR